VLLKVDERQIPRAEIADELRNLVSPAEEVMRREGDAEIL
jgi:hypothetical protein